MRSHNRSRWQSCWQVLMKLKEEAERVGVEGLAEEPGHGTATKTLPSSRPTPKGVLPDLAEAAD
jgi:hypothetical protein